MAIKRFTKGVIYWDWNEGDSLVFKYKKHDSSRLVYSYWEPLYLEYREQDSPTVFFNLNHIVKCPVLVRVLFGIYE